MEFREIWQIIQYLTLLQIYPNHQNCSKTVYMNGVGICPRIEIQQCIPPYNDHK